MIHHLEILLLVWITVFRSCTTNSIQEKMNQAEKNYADVKDFSSKDNSNLLVGDETDSTSEKKSHEDFTTKIKVEPQEQGTTTFPVLSKSALKRKKKAELWEQRKKEKRIKERENRKRKKLENPNHSSNAVTRKQLKSATLANSSCKVGLVIDLSLEKYMDERSLAKCIKQVGRCYSINRRAANPVQFHVSSLENKSLTEISKNTGYLNWDVNFHDKHYTEIFPKDKIVYLTSESENVIDKIEEDGVYVIGGLVDHNSQKGLCHRLALEKGLRHGRLPIGEHIDMKTRKVLTIDHVFHIMVNICNGQNWKDALLEVMPARKGAQEKSAAEDNSESYDDCETEPISTTQDDPKV
nr:EOG090X0D3U [Ceriodaphnia reticulata]